MRRWKRRYEQYGYDGLFDRRRGRPSMRRVPMEVAEQVLRLYQEKCQLAGRARLSLTKSSKDSMSWTFNREGSLLEIIGDTIR